MDSARVMTLNELADFLRVHPSTIYRLLKRGGLPAFKVGSDWRFNSESIDRWLMEREQTEGKRGEPSRVDNQLADD
jgi:excisionase family DNA binding protein